VVAPDANGATIALYELRVYSATNLAAPVSVYRPAFSSFVSQTVVAAGLASNSSYFVTVQASEHTTPRSLRAADG
jgi:hypothetical protein